MTGRANHWEGVYRTKSEPEQSWHQSSPEASLAAIREFAPGLNSRIIDVGAGNSRLADGLLAAGYSEITLVDISEAALEQTRERLGAVGSPVRFVADDLLATDELGTFDVWHDRALFHFLTDRADRAGYAELAASSVAPGGHLVLMTFAADGPERCSGLPVSRYDGEGLAACFQPEFESVRAWRIEHITPWGTVQPFQAIVLRRALG